MFSCQRQYRIVNGIGEIHFIGLACKFHKGSAAALHRSGRIHNGHDSACLHGILSFGKFQTVRVDSSCSQVILAAIFRYCAIGNELGLSKGQGIAGFIHGIVGQLCSISVGFHAANLVTGQGDPRLFRFRKCTAIPIFIGAGNSIICKEPGRCRHDIPRAACCQIRRRSKAAGANRNAAACYNGRQAAGHRCSVPVGKIHAVQRGAGHCIIYRASGRRYKTIHRCIDANAGTVMGKRNILRMARFAVAIIHSNSSCEVRRIGNQRNYSSRDIYWLINFQLQIGCINLRCISKIKTCPAYIPGIFRFHRTQGNGRNIFRIIHCIDQILSIVAGLNAFLLCSVQRYAFIGVGSKRMLVVGCVIIIVYTAEGCTGKQPFRLRC